MQSYDQNLQRLQHSRNNKKYCELMPFHVVIPALIWGVWVMHPMCDFSSIDIIFPIVTMVNESSIIINVDE